MKKLMFALALVSLVFTSAQAQRQLGGEHNVEVNLTPLGDSPIDGTTLKYRNFLDDDKALRVRLSLDMDNDTYAYVQNGEITEVLGLPETINPQLNLMTNYTMFGLGVGYEMHFGGTDNLSPYFGFEGTFASASTKHTKQLWGPNDLDDEGQFSQYITWELINSQSVTALGLGLFLGADYYFNDAIYIGIETGLALGVTTVNDHQISAQRADGVSGSALTAFNMEFGNPGSGTDWDSAPISDSFVGSLPFDVVTDLMYDEYIDGTTVVNTAPNLMGNFSFGNAFNTAIRFGYLFD